MKDFIIEIKEKVAAFLGQDYSVTARKVLKNNSVEYDCLSITYRNNIISPNIYLNGYYNRWINGESLDDISGDIARLYGESMKNLEGENCSFINTENASEKVILRLVNYSQNTAILKNCPHDRIDDLAVTYHFVVSYNKKDGLATARIDYNNIEFFKLTESQIRSCALSNTERMFPPMFERLENVLRSFIRENPMFDTGMVNSGKMSPMYLLTNTEKLNGAACILYKGMLQRIRKALDTNFFIIPSSINEVLIVPDTPEINRRSLEEMVKAVNKESVPETEVLSNKVYYYPEDSFECRGLG